MNEMAEMVREGLATHADDVAAHDVYFDAYDAVIKAGGNVAEAMKAGDAALDKIGY